MARAQPSSDAGSFRELDADALSWSVFDPGNKWAKLLRLRMYVRNGGQPVIFSENGKTENNPYLYMDFSLPRLAEIPDFQTQMEKAVKHLITLCGGVPEVTF